MATKQSCTIWNNSFKTCSFTHLTLCITVNKMTDWKTSTSKFNRQYYYEYKISFPLKEDHTILWQSCSVVIFQVVHKQFQKEELHVNIGLGLQHKGNANTDWNKRASYVKFHVWLVTSAYDWIVLPITGNDLSLIWCEFQKLIGQFG